MAQYGRPSSDISAGNWTDGGSAEVDGVLWNSVDEVTQDADVSYIVGDNTATTFKIKLSAVTDPAVHTGHQLVIYIRSDGSGGPEKLDIELVQGDPSETSILSINNASNRSGSYADVGAALSEAEAAVITDYTDLYVKGTADSIGSGEWMRVTQIYLQVPDASVIHDLTATNIVMGTPVLGSPGIGQTHGIGAANLLLGTPDTGTPTIGQAQVLAAVAMATGAFVLDAPTAGQVHALGAVGVVAAIPVLGLADLATVHEFGAGELLLGVPDVGTSALAQGHGLTAVSLDSGVPMLGAPMPGQVHALDGAHLVTGVPVLSTPTLNEGGTDDLTAVSFVAGLPILGTPGLGQLHVLTSDWLEAGVADVGSPGFEQIHGLAADAIAVSTPDVEASVPAQVHVLGADSLLTGIPVLGTPGFDGAYDLTAVCLTSGAVELGAPVPWSHGPPKPRIERLQPKALWWRLDADLIYLLLHNGYRTPRAIKHARDETLLAFVSVEELAIIRALFPEV